MTIRTFQFNLSVVDVFFLETNRTVFVGHLDVSLDNINFKKAFPCNATLVVGQKDIESFPLYFECFARKSDDPELKSFVTFKLETLHETIKQSIANKACAIRMDISFEDE